MSSGDSEPSLAALVNNLPGAIYRCRNDRNRGVLFISEPIREITGYSASDFLGGRVHYGDLIAADDRERIWQQVQHTLATKIRFDLEYRIARRDGQQRWISEQGIGVYDKSGELRFLEGYIVDITKQKYERDQVRASAKRLADAQRIGHMGSIEQHVEKDILYWSDEVYDLLEFDRDMAPSYKAFMARVHPDDRKEVRRQVDRAFTTGEPPLVEYRVILPSDQLRYFAASSTVIRDSAGKPERIIGIVQDVTERRVAEKKLRESEACLRRAQKLAHVGSFDGRAPFSAGDVSWSDELFRIMGRDRALGAPALSEMLAMLHPDDRERVLAATTAISTSDPIMFNHRIRRPDGQVRHLRTFFEAEFDDTGAMVRRFGATQDITEQMSAIAALEESETRMRAILDTAVDGIISIDERGIIESFNPAAERMFGYDADEVMGRNVSLLMPPPYGDEHDDYLARYVQTGKAKMIGIGREVEGRRKDGSVFPLELGVGEMRLGPDRRFTGILRDITERKAALEDLRQSQALLLRAQRMASLGTVVAHYPFGPGDLVWSEEIFRIFGRDPALGALSAREIVGATHPEDMAAMTRISEAFFSGRQRTFDFEWRIIRPDKQVRHLHSTWELETDSAGKPLRGVGVIRDVTDQRRLEREFRQAQKLEAVGTLTGGIAHDYNNLLMGILGCTDIALEKIPADNPARMYLEEARRAAKRGASLTRQLLTFSRRRETTPTDIAIDEVVATADKMIRSMLGEQIELRLKLRAPHWLISGDTGQMEQVLMNLVVNARDAMPQGGVLAIETAEVTLGQTSASRMGLPPGEFVTLLVRDTGAGMDAETRERIFDPFFTTKELGKGSGLGLATVYGIVTGVRGHISVHSEPGQGTTFTLHFPKSSVGTADAPSVAAETQYRRGTETILVVEDDPLVRLTVRGYLERWGYRILEACDLAEATLVLQHSRNPIDLLVTDAMLPGATGKQVAEQVTSLGGDVPIIFMSAHGSQDLKEVGRIPPDVTPLHKPFSEEVLLREVQRMLGNSPTDSAVTAETSPAPPTPQDTPIAATLLLVEDDDSARCATAELLSDFDYDVIATKTGAEALAACEQHRGAIDAVLTDVGLPDMSGTKLAAELRALIPYLAVVYVSGRSRYEIADDLLAAPRTAFVQKPVDVDHLAQLVGDLVRAGRPA